MGRKNRVLLRPQFVHFNGGMLFEARHWWELLLIGFSHRIRPRSAEWMLGKIPEDSRHDEAHDGHANCQARSGKRDPRNAGVAFFVADRSTWVSFHFHPQNATVSRGAPSSRGSLNGTSGLDFSCQKNIASHSPPTPTGAATSIQ